MRNWGQKTKPGATSIIFLNIFLLLISMISVATSAVAASITYEFTENVCSYHGDVLCSPIVITKPPFIRLTIDEVIGAGDEDGLRLSLVSLDPDNVGLSIFFFDLREHDSLLPVSSPSTYILPSTPYCPITSQCVSHDYRAFTLGGGGAFSVSYSVSYSFSIFSPGFSLKLENLFTGDPEPFALYVAYNYTADDPNLRLGQTLVGAIPIAPIPEPGALLLFGTGLAGLGVATWRRARRAS